MPPVDDPPSTHAMDVDGDDDLDVPAPPPPKSAIPWVEKVRKRARAEGGAGGETRNTLFKGFIEVGM